MSTRPIFPPAGVRDENANLLADEEEKRLLAALIVVFTGVEDVSKLKVPAEVGRRLLRCYDDLAKE